MSSVPGMDDKADDAPLGAAGIAAPVVILVRPQLPQNVGTAARAMANFGLSELRLVAPRESFPNEAALGAAVAARGIVERARIFPTLAEAQADLTFVYATTARERGQAKPVDGPEAAAQALVAAGAVAGARAGVVFGPERTGLENDEVASADRILTFPVDPEFSSLNLAQAVLLVGYEWSRAVSVPLPFAMPERWPGARKDELAAFFTHLEGALERSGYFHPTDKRGRMARNLRNIFARLDLSTQDVRTLHGVIEALESPRQTGVRRGRRVLDASED